MGRTQNGFSSGRSVGTSRSKIHSQSFPNALLAGAVYVFTRAGSSWSQQAYLKASNTNADDFFGASLALSSDGSTLAVGAKQEASNATGIGGNQVDKSANAAGAVTG